MLGYVLGITLVLTVLSPIILTDVFADSFLIQFDKESYKIDDTLVVSGEILEFGMPVIAMTVYDPDDKILSAHNLEIISESSFTKTLPLNSPFYEKTGEYLVKFDYGQISESHVFDIKNDNFEPEISVDTFVEPEIILLYTEQKQYVDNDVIHITGLVSKKDTPNVLIGIYDPFGMPVGFYFGSVDSNLEFTTNFLVKDGVNFRVDGTYSVKAHYDESEVIAFFDYHKVPQEIIVDSSENEFVIDDEIVVKNETNEIIDSINNETIIPSDAPAESSPTNSELVDISTEIQSVSKNEVNSIFIPTVVTTESSDTVQNNSDHISIKPIKENNLTVEDIELGKLLNQIKLDCDSSTYTDTISYYDGMGPALYRLCKFDNSLHFFNESLINNPNNVEILVNKGSALGKLGYFTEAILYYDHAIGIDPNFLPAKNNKANTLASLGHFQDAIFLYNEILNQNPNYLTARQNLEIASSSFDSFDDVEQNLEIDSLPKHVSQKGVYDNSVVPSSDNFFDNMGITFSSLGSLFGFLN